MTPPRTDHPGWNSVAKVSLTVVGSLLIITIGWAARAAEKQADALEQLKEAFYAGQKDGAVLGNRVQTVEHGLAETKDRVKVLESKLLRDK